MTPTKTIVTFEELELLPDEPGKQELLEGELIPLPPPKERHSQIAHRLFLLLHEHLVPGLKVRMETGYRLGKRTYVQPDVSVPHADQPAGDYLEGGPLIAFEIMSEANRAPHVQHKLALYFAHGTSEVWVLYPDLGMVEIHHADGSRKHVEPVASTLFPGLFIDPAELFSK